MLTTLLLSAAVAFLPVVQLTASHPSHGDAPPPVVSVHANAYGLRASPLTVPAGRLAFHVDTDNPDGDSVILLRLTPPATLDQVYADFRDLSDEDQQVVARGTRQLGRDARFYGLADVVPGSPATVTQTLPAGDYYLINGASLQGQSAPLALHVRSASAGPVREAPRAHPRATITMTAADTFIAPRTLPADEAILVRNQSHSLHVMYMWPVTPGTTDRAVQAWLDAGANTDPGFFRDGPAGGLNLLSPGLQATLGHQLPPGTYLILCEVPDPRTGIPHVFTGMHQIVSIEDRPTTRSRPQDPPLSP